MKLTKITFEQLYPTGPYANQRYSAEVELEPHDFANGEIPQLKVAIEAYQFAKKCADEGFKALNPELNRQPADFYKGPEIQHGSNTYFNGMPSKSQQPIPTINREAERIQIAIENAKTVEELIRVKDEVGKYGLVDMYADKLNILKKAKNV